MRTAIAAMVMIGSAPALAATQGDDGPRSAGSILITASVAAQARLLGAGGAPCVTLNTATRGFSTTGTPPLAGCGEGASGAGAATTRADDETAVIVAPE